MTRFALALLLCGCAEPVKLLPWQWEEVTGLSATPDAADADEPDEVVDDAGPEVVDDAGPEVGQDIGPEVDEPEVVAPDADEVDEPEIEPDTGPSCGTCEQSCGGTLSADTWDDTESWLLHGHSATFADGDLRLESVQEIDGWSAAVLPASGWSGGYVLEVELTVESLDPGVQLAIGAGPASGPNEIDGAMVVIQAADLPEEGDSITLQIEQSCACLLASALWATSLEVDPAAVHTAVKLVLTGGAAVVHIEDLSLTTGCQEGESPDCSPSCPSPVPPCWTEECGPLGGCTLGPNHGAECDDLDPCTTNDGCVGSTCTGGPPLVCADDNDCTTDSCKWGSGCVFEANTDPCSDGDECTTGDTCEDKVCTPTGTLSCSDDNSCTDDSCNSDTGCVFDNNTAPCDDGEVCTEPDACSGGACAGPPNPCDDGNACTTDSCAQGEGCNHLNKPNGNLCDDGDPCTLGGCKEGECKSSELNCDAPLCTLNSPQCAICFVGQPCAEPGCDLPCTDWGFGVPTLDGWFYGDKTGPVTVGGGWLKMESSDSDYVECLTLFTLQGDFEIEASGVASWEGPNPDDVAGFFGIVHCGEPDDSTNGLSVAGQTLKADETWYPFDANAELNPKDGGLEAFLVRFTRAADLITVSQNVLGAWEVVGTWTLPTPNPDLWFSLVHADQSADTTGYISFSSISFCPK